MCTFWLFGQASTRDRLIINTGLCTAAVQLLAAYTVQSMHAGIQLPCALYMTSPTHNKTSQIYKPQLLFESGLCVGMQLQKCRFYSRAAFIQDFMVGRQIDAQVIIISNGNKTGQTSTIRDITN